WIVLVMWTPAYLKQSPLVMSLVVLALDVAVFFVAFMDLELISRSFAPIAGTFLLIGGILGIYVASAIVLNTAFSKNVLPMPGPILK
ncbi:MAG: hypothetical protein PHW39_03750, partial [Syntrophomonadaceae bacterium]|nr:hypothetical protein [Syntrophomonadaceae bacterium]